MYTKFKKKIIKLVIICLIINISHISTSTMADETNNNTYQQIATGVDHTLEQMVDGRVKAWEINKVGQLGVGNKENQLTPVIIEGITLEELPPAIPTLTASTTETTTEDVYITITYPQNAVTKQYKIGEGEWQEYSKPVVVTDNTTVYARCMSSSGKWSEVGSIIIDNMVILYIPSNLNISFQDSSIEINWNAVENADTYKVARSRTSGGPYNVIANVPENSYLDKDVENDITYYYVVKAVNSEGESGYSREVTSTPIKNVEQRALLIIALSNGMEKTYDLSMEEVTSFVNWYKNPDSNKFYTINEKANQGLENKHNITNIVTKKSFNKIKSYKVSGYSVE